jgi:tRNA (adenine57-N1/adenine58-N1)-methyltransferase catalytic subunit
MEYSSENRQEIIEQVEPADGGKSVWFRPQSAVTRIGDLVLLLAAGPKRYLITLKAKQQLHSHLGIYDHDAMVGQPWGSVVLSSMGQPALLLEPTLTDLMTHLKRGTQIIYPKDAAMLVHRMNLRAGCRVVEAGTGSGSLTMALAWAVAPTGRVYTYEMRAETHQLARRNLERVGLLPYVDMYEGSVEDGFRQRDVDALFLDVRAPWEHLETVRATLKPGGFFASLIPTTNQVSNLVGGLDAQGFTDVAVEELLLRSYKPVAERLRPDDEMIAHTGYLVSARCLPAGTDIGRWQTKAQQRYRARQKMRAELAAEEERRHASVARGEGKPRKYPKLNLPE